MLLRQLFTYALVTFSVALLGGCATKPVIAPTVSIETNPAGMSVPYRLSSAGRIVIDVAVNGTEAHLCRFSIMILRKI